MSKSLLASAEKMSAGASTFMLIRLTHPMSGFARRPYSQPRAMIEKTGRMMPRTRSSTRFLKDVPGEILVAGDVLEPRVDVGGVDVDRFARVPGRIERELVEQPFHHRVQPPRADVLLPLVDGEGDLGEPPDRVRHKLEMDVLRRQQRLVLAHETGVGGREDLLEVVHRQRFQLHANGKASLQLGNEIG